MCSAHCGSFCVDSKHCVCSEHYCTFVLPAPRGIRHAQRQSKSSALGPGACVNSANCGCSKYCRIFCVFCAPRSPPRPKPEQIQLAFVVYTQHIVCAQHIAEALVYAQHIACAQNIVALLVFPAARGTRHAQRQSKSSSLGPGACVNSTHCVCSEHCRTFAFPATPGTRHAQSQSKSSPLVPATPTYAFYAADLHIVIQTVENYHTDVDITIQTVIRTIVN